MLVYSEQKTKQVIQKLFEVMKQEAPQEQQDNYLQLIKASAAYDMLELTSVMQKEPEKIELLKKGEIDPNEFNDYVFGELTEENRNQVFLQTLKRSLDTIIFSAELSDQALQDEAKAYVESIKLEDLMDEVPDQPEPAPQPQQEPTEPTVSEPPEIEVATPPTSLPVN